MDEVTTGGGAAVGGDVSAKSVTGRDSYWRRNSPSVNVQLGEAFSSLQSDLLELKVDLKLLQNMAEERRMQVLTLQGWVIMMALAMLLQTIMFVFFVVMTWR